MAWDVTVPDIYADSHIDKITVRPGAAADKAAQNNIGKYARLASTHISTCLLLKHCVHGETWP